ISTNPCKKVQAHSSLREGAGTAIAVTEGASGRCSSGFIMGRYLLMGIDTMNFFHWVLSSNRLVLPAGGLTFLLRQESKQRSRLKGGTTRSRSNCSPLENPPGGTIGRLTLRFGSG